MLQSLSKVSSRGSYVPTFELSSSKNNLKAGKDLCHFMRHFGHSLFLATLIREDRAKRSKFLPAFKLFSSKNSLKAGKALCHFMRLFGHPLFLATLIREDRVKRSKFLPAFKLFLSKNSLKAGKDFEPFTWSSRNITRRPRQAVKILTGL